MVKYEWTKELCKRYADSMRSMVKYDHKPWAKKIFKKVSEKPESPVLLDIATGPGFLLFELAKHFSESELIANDSSENMLEIAEKEAEKNNFYIKSVLSSAENIEVSENTADFVTCKQLLHESDDPERVIAEMFRTTKNKSKAFIIDFDSTGNKFLARFIKFFILIFAGKDISENFWKSFKAGLEGIKVKDMMENSGFTNVKYEKIGYNYFIFGDKV